MSDAGNGTGNGRPAGGSGAGGAGGAVGGSGATGGGRSSRNRRSSNRSGRMPQARQLRPEDLWRTGLPLADAEPITPVDDPTALVRSLGDPPLPGNRLPAGHYLASVVERAAQVASALAASAGLLAQHPDGPDHP